MCFRQKKSLDTYNESKFKDQPHVPWLPYDFIFYLQKPRHMWKGRCRSGAIFRTLHGNFQRSDQLFWLVSTFNEIVQTSGLWRLQTKWIKLDFMIVKCPNSSKFKIETWNVSQHLRKKQNPVNRVGDLKMEAVKPPTLQSLCLSAAFCLEHVHQCLSGQITGFHAKR